MQAVRCGSYENFTGLHSAARHHKVVKTAGFKINTNIFFWYM